MFPPAQGLHLDIEAISGICGSISIACWVVVFSPQIVENFRRGCADGLSMQFIIVWLVGDVFNILGAVVQRVLPTMIILAVYYTLADVVLLGQCFYYKGFTWRDEVKLSPKPILDGPLERTPLLDRNGNTTTYLERERRLSGWSSVDATHLSPVTPLLDASISTSIPLNQKPMTRLQAILFNIFTILMVCTAGVFGWWMSNCSKCGPHEHDDTESQPHRSNNELSFNLWGQVFGYLCAILYLGSRIPQILLNYRRKSTEGVSMLFFLFACIGNLTYALSIFAFEAHCQAPHGECENGERRRIYGRYILINASWLTGSLGTLLLDLTIFVQFFLYRQDDRDISPSEEENTPNQINCVGNGGHRYDSRNRTNGRASYDDRPLLQRDDSVY